MKIIETSAGMIYVYVIRKNAFADPYIVLWSVILLYWLENEKYFKILAFYFDLSIFK